MEAAHSISSDNRALAKQILKLNPGKDVKKIVNTKSFKQDPTRHMIDLMISRRTGRAVYGDYERAFVISQIPNFADSVGSHVFLKKIAEERFKDHLRKDEIIDCFDRSTKTELFQKTLYRAVKKIRQAKLLDNLIKKLTSAVESGNKKEFRKCVSRFSSTNILSSMTIAGLLAKNDTPLEVKVKAVSSTLKSLYNDAEDELRVPLSIFAQIEELELFKIPREAAYERAKLGS